MKACDKNRGYNYLRAEITRRDSHIMKIYNNLMKIYNIYSLMIDIVWSNTKDFLNIRARFV